MPEKVFGDNEQILIYYISGWQDQLKCNSYNGESPLSSPLRALYIQIMTVDSKEYYY
jgi:hypothetical protein